MRTRSVKIRRTAYLITITVLFVFVLGCGEKPAVTEKRIVHALIDSVEALPHVVLFAGDYLRDARSAVACGDSLMGLDQGPLARISYAEATVFLRLSIVDAESEELRSLNTSANPDSS
jgi:hypothetical protein